MVIVKDPEVTSVMNTWSRSGFASGGGFQKARTSMAGSMAWSERDSTARDPTPSGPVALLESFPPSLPSTALLFGAITFLFTSPLKLLGTEEFESELVVDGCPMGLGATGNLTEECDTVEEACLGIVFA